jgi:hypothetical protein
MPLLLAALCILVSCSRQPPGLEPITVTIPEARLQELHKATVLVTDNAQKTRHTGLLVERSENGGCVAVLGELPERTRVVLHSGTPQEVVLFGRRIGHDQERDISLLEVSLAGLPSALDLAGTAPLSDDMPTYVIGFSLDPGDGEAPSGYRLPLIIAGSLYGLGNDPNRVDMIGFKAHGGRPHSGGVLVTSEGVLLGLAGATGPNQQTTLSLPAVRLKSYLDGTIEGVEISQQVVKPGAVNVQVEVTVSSPLNRIENLSLLLFRSESIDPLQPDSEQRWPVIPGRPAGDYSLPLAKGKAVRTIKLFDDTLQDQEYLAQVRCLTTGGGGWYSEPVPLLVRFSGREPVAAASAATTMAIEFEETVTKSEVAISETVIAGNGDYLVLRSEGSNILQIYDVGSDWIRSTIRLLSADFLLAAGGDCILVYFPNNKTFQTYNPFDGALVATRHDLVQGLVTSIVMGSGRSDAAIVRRVQDRGATSYLLLSTDPPKLVQSLNRPVTVSSRIRSHESTVRLSADSRLRSFCESSRGRLQGWYGWTGEGYEQAPASSSGLPLLGSAGHIVTSQGEIIDSSLQRVAEASGWALQPTLTPGLVLGITGEGRLAFFGMPDSQPLIDLGTIPGGPAGRVSLCHPQRGDLVLLTADRRHLVHRRFKLQQVLEQSGKRYLIATSWPDLVVSPGGIWRYQVQALSYAGGIDCNMVSGPATMQRPGLDAFTWVAPTSGTDREPVVLEIRDRAGTKQYQRFTIRVKSPVIEEQHTLDGGTIKRGG